MIGWLVFWAGAISGAILFFMTVPVRACAVPWLTAVIHMGFGGIAAHWIAGLFEP
jgi:hypothetical protein